VRCPICRAWADEDCDHLTPEGDVRPEYEAAARVAEADERRAEEQMAEEFRLSQEWRRKGLI
jgi:hypothetical protein